MSRVTDFSEQFMRDLAKAADDGLREAAFIASDLASASMPGAGARVVGATATKRAIYKPSRPGSPPGIRTNELKGSISFQRLQPGVWGFGTSVKHGRYLELGAHTPGGQPFFKKDGEVIYASRKSPHAHRMAKTKPGYIQPRPFLTPVALRKQSILRNSFQREAAASLARSTTARAVAAARGVNG